MKIKVRLQSEKFEWTNVIWKQIDTNVLSITLHQKQSLVTIIAKHWKKVVYTLSDGLKVHGINHNFFVFRQVTLFIHGIFFRCIYSLV